MSSDDEGFLYPVTDALCCMDCGLCGRICPANKREAFRAKTVSSAAPLSAWAAWHLDEGIRRDSSSGGVFSALAEKILALGGVVAGAAFEDGFVVRHISVESSRDLPRLRGSKYVQSELSQNLYKQIREWLKMKRPVLFSGTPCQVAGLRSFLQHDCEELYCCDVVCYGVPSPLLLEKFIEASSVPENELMAISFRDKSRGWKHFCMLLSREKDEEYVTQSSRYMAAFLRGYALRRSCYDCHFSNLKRPGDITLADFWGVARRYPEYDQNDKGTSLILVNTEKGKHLLSTCHADLFLGPADLGTAVAGNPALFRPNSQPRQRKTFYLDLKNQPFHEIVRNYKLYSPTKLGRLAQRSKNYLKGVARRWLWKMEAGVAK